MASPHLTQVSFSNPPSRNEIYYLDPVIFQVEDQLFNVPKYHFVRHSEIFRTMFLLPPPKGSDSEGSTDRAPIQLDGVDKMDFQIFLEVLYPLETMVDMWAKMTKSKWLSVLKLATMWVFKEIRALAIDRLTKWPMGEIEQIVLAKQYNVSQWLLSGYQKLAMRSEMVSLEEAAQIGYLSTILIFQVREQVGHQTRRRPDVATTVVEYTFKREVREMELAYDDQFLADGAEERLRVVESTMGPTEAMSTAYSRYQFEAPLQLTAG